MKIEIVEPENKKIDFPKLMQASSGLIVLIFEESLSNPENLKGIVIDPVSRLGEYQASWDKSQFEDFKGTIILNND